MHWMGILITLLPLKLMGLMYKQFHVTLCMTSVAGPRIELDLLGSAKLVELISVLGHLRTSVGKIACAMIALLGGLTFVSIIAYPVFL